MAKILLIIALSTLGAVCAYKSGAPDTDEICKTMTPDHMSTVQPINTFPYAVSVDETSIKPGQKVTFKMTGNKDNPIRGFFVQARVGNTPIGQFEEGPEVQTRNCLQGVKNAATHKNGNPKDEVKTTWTAPNDLQESVTFRVTAVKKVDTYWVGYETAPVSVTAG